MIVERTKQYFDTCTDYRRELREIWEGYEIKLKRLGKYEGSEGYEADKAKLEHDRDAAISSLQGTTRERFNTILQGMRETVKGRTLTPPTPEQLSLLQALKMRDNVSRDELEQAGNSLKDCPVALGVLSEIADKMAEKNGGRRYVLRFETESTSGILACIDSLTESAKRICALNKCDSRGEQALRTSIHYHPEGIGVRALYSFRVDRDSDSIEDCMEFYGGVRNLDSFENAVNSY